MAVTATRNSSTRRIRAVSDPIREGKPARLKELFESLCKELRRFGPLRIDAVKSSINLIPHHHMGGIRVLSQRLEVGFVLSRRIENPRIKRRLKVGPSMYAHTVDLAANEDLDTELLSWLKEAYDRSARN